MSKFLTKSKYKLGLECPNKLYYIGKKEYANQKNNDPFLQALADGGFQVEELAKMHYPEGILIEDRKSDDSYDHLDKVRQTEELLKRKNVVIFEAAFLFDNLFIRVDILEKKENSIRLIEVKAKSFHPDNQNEFIKSRGIVSKWKPFLFDVAFQKYVIEKSHPEFSVTPFLMLADKSKSTSIEGLNQYFRITKSSDNRTGVINKLQKLSNIKLESVLSEINVSDIIDRIEEGNDRILKEFDFETSITELSNAYKEDRYYNYPLHFNECKKCEFKNDDDQNKKSGFNECFKKQLCWTDKDFERPNIFEIWDYRSWSKINESGVLFLDEIDDNLYGDIKLDPYKISRVERQLIQRDKSVRGEETPYLLKEELKQEMKSWNYPLNFIDFETSTSALPFFIGQHPYEDIAFQFSHHIYYEDGRIEHANEYINTTAGEFPNFIFIRELKRALESNQGSVFMYSNHENKILNKLIKQLESSTEKDKEELIEFTKSITKSPNDSPVEWKGERAMIDLRKVIVDYYYNPITKGSNSIKQVLPAVYETCNYIKDKYCNPINEINISSKNFEIDKRWMVFEEGKVCDPYKTLPKVFEEWSENYDIISELEEINHGGAALTAYGKLQYTDMSREEREAIKSSLLKYCELDTLAMVIIYEHLINITNS